MFSKVYVLYPRGVMTGGPEACHQLVDTLRALNIEAQLVAHPSTTANQRAAYDRYDAPEAPDWVDAADCAIVVPEIYIHELRSVKNAARFAWWLSIDNSPLFRYSSRWRRRRLTQEPLWLYPALLAKAADETRARARAHLGSLHHFAQSAYAAAFLHARYGLLATPLSDYTAHATATPVSTQHPRQIQSVAYNPAKGGEMVEALARRLPEVRFIPLKNMRPDEVRGQLSRAGIYLDLGHHPGKDRLPREAASSGALVLVSMRGSAAYYADVPLPAEAKIAMFGDPIANAEQALRRAMANYQCMWDAQAPYREAIRKERDRFVSEVKANFIDRAPFPGVDCFGNVRADAAYGKRA